MRFPTHAVAGFFTTFRFSLVGIHYQDGIPVFYFAFFLTRITIRLHAGRIASPIGV